MSRENKSTVRKDPLASVERITPMFRQWQAAKKAHPDALLFFRMGDFYELFFDDAKTAAPLLEIALTARGKGSSTAAPMCGVPHHAARGYIARLVEKGHRVAVCEQMEDPKKTKGMVRREVIRVVSPGTITDPAHLDPGTSNYLAAITGTPGGPFGAAFVDLSTGGMVLSEARNPELLADLLGRFEVAEILAPESLDEELEALSRGALARPALVTTIDEDLFHPLLARQRVVDALAVASLAGFGGAEEHPALPAAAAALQHLGETQRVRPAHLDRLRVEDPRNILHLDRSSRRNLEIVANLRDGSRRETLLEVLDLTLTPMGARTLRAWLLEPLAELEAILARLAVVDAFFGRSDTRERSRGALKGIRDIERLLGRAALSRATPHDLTALRASLAQFPDLLSSLGELDLPDLRTLAARIDPLRDLSELLEAGLADEPGSTVGEGRVIREDFDSEFDEVRDLARNARRTIAALEAREREATGIATLKVRYNRVFGYFIEVSKSKLSQVPEHYQRRQTLATGERYITPEVKELEEKILSAEERLSSREKELFESLVGAVIECASRLRSTAQAIAETDVLAGFAEVAAREGYVRPLVTREDRIRIEDGRHPVVERLLESGRFVPNDCTLDGGRRLLVVTGPNMGGKSTFLRQVALTVLMAHTGSFVPARAAEIGVADRIFCRVGASDNLAGGESTFMVEMTETANILHNATRRSLVILDEIGRGTATWDGMAIAWAVVEHLLQDERLQPKALFATHYHELTELAAEIPELDNVHISVREHGKEIIFLHRIEAGPSDRSYGIHVARLAGLPTRVVDRAWEILERISADHTSPGSAALRSSQTNRQLPLFADAATSPAEEEVLDALRGTDSDEISPREAHALLSDFIERLRRDA